jgi:hypothetical protein
MSFIKPDTRFYGFTDKPHIMPVAMHEYGLMKQAAGDMHPDIDAYIRKARPIPGKNILLIDALGAGEVWGPNVNGDYFPREELTRGDTNAGYRSFEYHAYPYKHHQNEARDKDEKRRYGEKVVMSRYFAPMDRVQLIAIVDSSPGRADDIVTQCDQGMHPDVSMACGVAYDQCSICGKIHRTRRDYCEHCERQLNRIFPDGQKVFLYNFRPRFHDISFVFVGADRSAKVLRKVASAGYDVVEATRGGYDLNYVTMMFKEAMESSASPKRAEIEKKIVLDAEDNDVKIKKIAKIADEAMDNVEKFAAGDPDINLRTLTMLSKYAMGDVISTLNQMAIPLRPHEFQYLMLSAGGNQKRAMELHQSGQCFDADSAEIEDVSIPDGEFSHEIAKIAAVVAPDRSGHAAFVMTRAHERDMGKRAAAPSFAPTSFVWPLMGGLFMAYKKKLPNDLKKVIAKGAKQISPYVTPIAAGTAVHMAINMGRALTPYDNGYEEDYAKDNFMDYGMLSDPIGENTPFDDFTIDDTSILDKISGNRALPYIAGGVSVPLIYMYSSFARNKAKNTPDTWERMGPVNRFVAKHPDASAVLGLLGAPMVVKTLNADTSIFKKLGS